MLFQETGLRGAWIIEPEPIADERGSFARTFCEREYAARRLCTRFVQHSQSHSLKEGTLRGMHFQAEPDAEVKVVSCLRGAILDIIADLRPPSATYLQWVAVELTAANRRQIYVPKGFAHGFITLCDDAMVNYLISEFHKPERGRGIRYDDPALGILWPREPSVVSDKDLNWEPLSPQSA